MISWFSWQMDNIKTCIHHVEMHVFLFCMRLQKFTEVSDVRLLHGIFMIYHDSIWMMKWR